MKNRVLVLILALISIGLGIAVVTIKNKARVKEETDLQTITTFSNKLGKAITDLEEEQKVTAMVEKDLDGQKKSFGELTNKFSLVSSDLAKSEASLKASQEELKQRETKITELESQNQALDKHALELTNQINTLTTQIADTQQRLARSEGDKAFLDKELKRMMSEKAELERQFNDLTVLRAQVSKIKEDMLVARRLEWSRQGVYASMDMKGAQRLMQAINPPATKAPQPNYDLNVEVRADGSVKVVPPKTNSPTGGNLPVVR